jgi:hypothetical protein
MGPSYDIDEETGEIIYQDSSTGWELVRVQLSEEQLDRLIAFVDAQDSAFTTMLQSLIQETK